MMAAPVEDADLIIGEDVLVNGKYKGTLRFIGPTSFATGLWYGVEMEKSIGKHEGMGYFTTAPKHGTFVKRENLEPFCERSQAASSINGLARMTQARREFNSALENKTFNRLDADDEAQSLLRWQLLVNTTLGEVMQQRARLSEEQMARLLREAEAMAVEPGYQGPSLTLPVTEADAWALMEAFREGRQLHYKYAMLLLQAYRIWASGLPTLAEVSVPSSGRLTVVGDTHGQLEDLLTIFTLNGVPSPTNAYLMNGDFVDRGPRGTEIVLCLMAWCLAGLPPQQQPPAPALAGAFPYSPYAPGQPLPPCLLQRGNHESHSQNGAGGFLQEVLLKYGTQRASGGKPAAGPPAAAPTPPLPPPG